MRGICFCDICLMLDRSQATQWVRGNTDKSFNSRFYDHFFQVWDRAHSSPIVGKGMVRSAGEVEITEGGDAGKVISGSKIMIATGCKPRTLDEVAVDGERVMTSREALAMKKQPESIAIMGAGAIGAEFAYFLNAFGTKVTLVEMLPNVLPVEDKEVSDALSKSFKRACSP